MMTRARLSGWIGKRRGKGAEMELPIVEKLRSTYDYTSIDYDREAANIIEALAEALDACSLDLAEEIKDKTSPEKMASGNPRNMHTITKYRAALALAKEPL